MKAQLTTLLALSLASSMSLAATSFSFNDVNDDGKLSKDEFYSSVSDDGIYADWDLDNDGLIVEDEFNKIGWDYDFAAWDVDNNGYLDASEVYDSYYTAYDEDEDGHWNMGEWDDADDEGWLDV